MDLDLDRDLDFDFDLETDLEDDRDPLPDRLPEPDRDLDLDPPEHFDPELDLEPDFDLDIDRERDARQPSSSEDILRLAGPSLSLPLPPLSLSDSLVDVVSLEMIRPLGTCGSLAPLILPLPPLPFFLGLSSPKPKIYTLSKKMHL